MVFKCMSKRPLLLTENNSLVFSSLLDVQQVHEHTYSWGGGGGSPEFGNVHENFLPEKVILLL